MKDLGIRVLSGVIGFLLLLYIVTRGGALLKLSVYILSIIGLRELYKAFENMAMKPLAPIGYLGATGLFLAFVYDPSLISLSLTLTTMLGLLMMIFIKDISIKDIGLTLLGTLYIPFLLFHIIFLAGTKYIWLVFTISFGTDIFAYLAGNLFGKRKLAPKISPNKTIEGSIGGIVGAIGASLIYGYFFNLGDPISIVIISLLGSIISQMGDLTASRIKRQAGIKDYGFIMPGHGGVLDRFDSIIFATPVVYYYVSIFII